MKKTIGQRINERRKELNMSADDLATKLSKDRSTIYRYEKGDIENLPIDLLKPIADALDMTPASLMGWQQDEIDAVASAHDESMEDTDSLDQIIGEMYPDRNQFISNQRLWMEEVGETNFSPEEIKQIMEYTKFLISQRKD